MLPCATAPHAHRTIRLPQSAGRNARQYAHCKLIRRIRQSEYSIAFEGTVLRPGARIEPEDLGPNPVLIECAGPVGKGQYRDFLWILWRFDWPKEQWVEIARAQSIDAAWAKVLIGPARDALDQHLALYEVGKRAAQLAARIEGKIMEALDQEDDGKVRANALSLIYDRVAGRIAGMVA